MSGQVVRYISFYVLEYPPVLVRCTRLLVAGKRLKTTHFRPIQLLHDRKYDEASMPVKIFQCI